MPIGIIAGAVISGAIASATAPSASGEAFSNASYAATREQAAIAREQYDWWKKNFAWLDEALAKEAKTAGDQKDQEQWAARAGVGTSEAFKANEGIRRRQLQALGLNPASPAYQSDASGLSRAAAVGGAENEARWQAENAGFAKRLDVANIGRGIPATSSAALGSAAGSLAGLAGQQYAVNAIERNNAAYAAAPIGNAVSDWIKSKSAGWFTPAAADVSSTWTGLSAPGATAALSNYYGTTSAPNVPSGLNKGGRVDGPGGVDQVPAEIDGKKPAALTRGEFVLNRGAVELMDKTAPGLLEDINSLGIVRRANGGPVPGGRGSVYANDWSGGYKPLRTGGGEGVKSGVGARVLVRDFGGSGEQPIRRNLSQLLPKIGQAIKDAVAAEPTVDSGVPGRAVGGRGVPIAVIVQPFNPETIKGQQLSDEMLSPIRRGRETRMAEEDRALAGERMARRPYGVGGEELSRVPGSTPGQLGEMGLGATRQDWEMAGPGDMSVSVDSGPARRVQAEPWSHDTEEQDLMRRSQQLQDMIINAIIRSRKGIQPGVKRQMMR